MRVGFTGTQIGMSIRQKTQLKLLLLFATDGVGEFHHGDCIGADADAHKVALECGWPVILHPPDIDSKRAFCKDVRDSRTAKPYLERNHEIVDETELLIAAPKNETQEELRSGTWATVRYARKQGKRVILLVRSKPEPAGEKPNPRD